MTLRDSVTRFLSLGAQPQPAQLPAPGPWSSHRELIQRRTEEIQTRAIDSYQSYPGLEQQLLQIQGLNDRPWRYPGINEALGTPAIFRAVSLIANTTGSLAMEAYRRGVKLPDEEMPRVIKRPDPFTIPRNFYRDTAYFLATRGEYWWWVGARDTDGLAMSLICVPPWEVTVEATDDRLRPTIKWLNKEMRRDDMRHGTFLRDDTGYRGVGPLQLCGAAISVAVEAQNWAANFYAEGGYPSIVIKSATELGQSGDTAEHEAETLRNAWIARAANTPRVIDPGIESIEKFDVDEQATGALEGRNRNDGDAARMFGIPGALLEYASSGSSLTYQNVAEVYRQFVQTCLAPNYLEPIEQELSDLLPRTTVARFNVKGLLRADIKTRFEVYGIGIDKGIITAETAAAEEGYLPGDVEFAPIPFSEPSAVPTRLPIQLRAAEPVRCSGKRLLRGILKPCNKLLAESGSFTGSCPRCGKLVDVKAVVIPQTPQPVTQPLVFRSVAVQEAVEVVPPEPVEPDITMRELVEALPALFAAAIPRQEPAVVNFHERAINVEAPPPAQMTISEGAIHVDNHVAAPDMSQMPAAQMTIAEGAIQTTVNVPPAQPEPPTSSRVVKDADGNITITRNVA